MDTISLNPMGPAPVQKSGGGKTTLYIVVFFLCVISAMAGAFYFMMGQKDAASAKKLEDLKRKAEADMAAAKSEEEKREIARKAEIDAQKATLSAKEEMLKKAQARVDAELSEAAKRVREAKELQRKAADAAADADTKQKEADEAMKKAEETNDANAKKLAEEKKKLADEAAAKVAKAKAEAKKATDKAKAEAKKATDLQKRLKGAEAKLRGKNWEKAAAYRAVPGYTGGFWKEAGKSSNPWVCAQRARAQGSLMWGHRGSTHSNPKYRNTCFIYKPNHRPKYKGNTNDDAHITGCAFSGYPNSRCHRYPQVRLAYHSNMGGPKWRSARGNRDVGYVGKYWNDKFSSIYVPHNTWLGVYKHANYKGGGWGIRGPRYLPSIGGWNDKISSLRIRHF